MTMANLTGLLRSRDCLYKPILVSPTQLGQPEIQEQGEHMVATVMSDFCPVGLCVSELRIIVECNPVFASMFGYDVEEVVGKISFSDLYPSSIEADNIGTLAYKGMAEQGLYNDERIMRRKSGELFWCRVAGRPIVRENPIERSAWMFEDISVKRPLTTNLSSREREIARAFVSGKPVKTIASDFNLSTRTIESHKANIMQKICAKNHADMLIKLAGIS